MFHQPVAENIKLDDKFKDELQHLIDKQLEK